ncbi:MAG: 2Fe-2S iron-sulfur cluster binding domain-containing protein [Phycisphaera sp.]|nr:2Fe-2S iron-sulfur cluster binding domain-containing protein [Phycisphaera sp.]
MQSLAANLWIVGAIAVGLVMVYALVALVDVVGRVYGAKAQRERELALLEQRVAAARKQRDAQQQQSLSWTGWRKFEVRRKFVETGDNQLCSFYLYPHDGKPIPTFAPGQFLTFQLNIPEQSRPVVRCYSLSDAPRADHYRVTIKRVPPPRNNPDAPPGVASNFFHDQINEGDLVDCKAPGGQFHIDMASNTPVVLIGGGVGLTPVLSMLNAIDEAGTDREVWFFYGVRHKLEHAMRTHLREIAQRRPNVHLHVCYSNPEREDKQGKDYEHACRVSVDLFRKVLPSSNYEYYMCGPPPMMEQLVKDLEEWGVPANKIHLEKFGPASGRQGKKEIKPTSGGPQIVFKKSGVTVGWSAEANNVWEFADANGVRIDCGCLEGNCGTCATAILKGEVEYNKKPEFEVEAGSCLTCCCKPKGDLELDA